LLSWWLHNLQCHFVTIASPNMLIVCEKARWKLPVKPAVQNLPGIF
jgi:hypothetical protein